MIGLKYHHFIIPKEIIMDWTWLLTPQKERQRYTFLNLCNLGASQVTLVKNPPTNAGHVRDGGSVPGSGRSPGGGNGSRLKYSCLENSMDKGDW